MQSHPWGSVFDFFSCLGNSLKRDGLPSVLAKTVLKARTKFIGLFGLRDVRKTQDKDFDLRFGIDTAEGVPRWKLNDVISANKRFASSYVPSQEKDVLMLLSLLPVCPQEYLFVDIGSGKGKVLLLAAEYGFKRIVGVEFSPHLHAIAEANVSHYLGNSSRDCQIECRCLDAADYPIPSDKLVMFLYNPFEAVVIQSILRRLQESLRVCDRQVFVINFGSLLRGALCDSEFLRPISGKGGHWIYSNKAVIGREQRQ